MKKRNRLNDLLIMLGMVIFVFLMCQPLGRRWDEGTKDMFTGDEGVYSPDSDTFFFLRKAREFTENGISSIRVFVSLNEDPLVSSFAEEGTDTMPVLLSALAALVWYMLQAVGVHVSIYSIAMHFCGAVLALCTIPLYLFLRKRVSRFAASLGAILGALSTAYLQHSFTGFFDTDSLICLFALIIVLSFHDCILEKNEKKQIVYGAISVVGVVLLSMTWSMFQIYVIIAIGTGGAAIFISRLFLSKRNETELKLRTPLITCGVMVLVLVALGGKDAYMLIRNVISSVKGGGKWPPTYENVGEMARPGLLSVKSFWEFFLGLKTDYVSYVGGLTAFLFLAVSIVLYSVDSFRILRKQTDVRQEMNCRYLMTMIWFLGSLLMCFGGIRFSQFLVLPAALIWAYGFDYIERKFEKQKSTSSRRVVCVVSSIIVFSSLVFAFPILAVVLGGVILSGGFFLTKLRGSKMTMMVLWVALLSGTIVSAYLRGKYSKPLLEKPTVNAMTWIRDNADESAVIVDYWSWGYRYQYYSKRRTIVDGGTYSGEMNYWLATMLFTDDEQLSVGIARMLQQSGIKGVDYAVELCGDEATASELLKQLLKKSREDAEKYLVEEKSFSEDERINLLSFTHPSICPELYFVADYEMLMHSASIGSLLNWDFSGNQSGLCNTLVTKESMDMPYEDKASEMELVGNGQTEYLLLKCKCSGDKIIGQILTAEGKTIDFSRIIYIKDGKKTFELNQPLPQLGEMGGAVEEQVLVLFEEKGRLSAVVADKMLIDSVLFRLYLFDGEGQQTFTRVFGDEIPERISGEPSQIQRKLGTNNTRGYRNCGITVWKACVE